MKRIRSIKEALIKMGEIFVMSASDMMTIYAMAPMSERFIAYDHIYQPYFRL